MGVLFWHFGRRTDDVGFGLHVFDGAACAEPKSKRAQAHKREAPSDGTPQAGALGRRHGGCAKGRLTAVRRVRLMRPMRKR